MKAVLASLVSLALLSVTTPSSATVAGPAPNEESTTAEAVAVTAASALAFGNTMMMAGKTPYYIMGGLGVAAGLTNWLLAAGKPIEYEGALWASGIAAFGTGIAAMRYRYVLNRRQQQARLEPTWTHGSPGLALVIDF